MKCKCPTCEATEHVHNFVLLNGKLACETCLFDAIRENENVIAYEINASDWKMTKRIPSFFDANGLPSKIRVYDNGGETNDRYTIVFTGNYRQGGDFVYMGANSTGTYHGESKTQIDRPAYSHLGKTIDKNRLPRAVMNSIMETYCELWGFSWENETKELDVSFIPIRYHKGQRYISVDSKIFSHFSYEAHHDYDMSEILVPRSNYRIGDVVYEEKLNTIGVVLGCIGQHELRLDTDGMRCCEDLRPAKRSDINIPDVRVSRKLVELIK